MGSMQEHHRDAARRSAHSPDMQKAADKVDEKQINRVEAIINSMTAQDAITTKSSTAAAASASPAAPEPPCRR